MYFAATRASRHDFVLHRAAIFFVRASVVVAVVVAVLAYNLLLTILCPVVGSGQFTTPERCTYPKLY